MVRLRREIEGIAINHALPVPAYALDSVASQLILPSLDERIEALEPGRVLLAGVPTPHRARALVAAGHHVTIADVARDEIAAFNDQLGPEIAAKLTLMDKPYGETSFGPSSFDAVLLLDTLHRFAKPMWVAQKAFRELKFDGWLICRVWVHGDAPADTQTAESSPSPLPKEVWNTAAKLWRGKVRRLFLDARGRDAIDRGAHLGGQSLGCDWASTQSAVSQKVTHINTIIGATQRLRAVELLFGARDPVRGVLARAVTLQPELADATDVTSDGARVIGGIWRKQLGGARFGR